MGTLIEDHKLVFKIDYGLMQVKSTVKPVLNGHSKRLPKIGFQDVLSFNAGEKNCRMLQESILQDFRPSLSYHLSLRPLFCPIFEWPLYKGFKPNL